MPQIRTPCSKFGTKKFIAAVGMLQKKYSRAKAINKLTVNSHFFQNYFSLAKIEILTQQVNIRTLHRVYEI